VSKVTTRKLGQPTWVDLASDDPDAARAFYGSLLGWEFEVFGPEFGAYSMARRGGADVAGIGPKPPGVVMPTAWNLYLGTSDVDATVASALAHGGGVLGEAFEVPGTGRGAMLQDPAGAIVGLWQSRGMDGFAIAGEPGAFAWCEVWTSDNDVSRAFYRDVFGYEVHDMTDDGFVYATLRIDGDDVAGVGVLDPAWGPGVPPHWAVYFAVEDADAAVGQVAALGGQAAGEPTDTPYGRVATVTDPQGAHFRVIAMREV